MAQDYFSPAMQDRTLMIWSIACRRQLERWEPLVAEYLRLTLANESPSGRLVWDANIEHHLLLVACHNLVKAIDKFDADIPIDPVVKAELTQVRDLLEHWHENMPIFNVKPRQSEPKYPSGKAFTERNPGRSPYWWLYWDSKENQTGVTINVSARAVYELVEKVQRYVFERDPGLIRFVPEEWLPED